MVITGCDSVEILDQALEAARTFRPLSEADGRGAAGEDRGGARSRGEFELFKTSSIFDSTAKNPAWLGEEPERLQRLVPG